MKPILSRTAFVALAGLVGLSACSDSPVAVPKPASITLLSGDNQTATVGQAVAIAPTFVVKDASGNVIPTVAVHVEVTVGGGTLASPPSGTSNGVTSIGTWTLGKAPGANAVAIAVEGLQPIFVNATAVAGAPATITATSSQTITARAGDTATPSIHVADAFGNALAGTTVSLSASPTSTSPASVVTDASGNASIATWQVGTVAGQSTLTATAGTASATFVATVLPGPAAMLLVCGDQPRGRGGAPADPIVLRVTDTYGNAIGNQSATFTLTGGGGVLAGTSAASAGDGAITMPTWTFGRFARTQSVHAAAGAFATDINIPIATDFRIDVRFFGGAMTDEQKSWFTNAAARISAIVTGDVKDVAVANLDVSSACGITGLPVMNETIDDLVIYASVSPIDGAGKILAEAGPCVFRNASDGLFSAVGVMLFDSADMASMAQQGMTQDVITHEMLHVVGIGTLWQDKSLLLGAGTTSVGYTGVGGKQGCLAGGGTTICASTVPVENNGVLGTADAHWRESTFGNELMTGFANTGGMPLSAITVGSLGDMGYVVNPFAADPFTIPGTSGASGNLIPRASTAETWEKHTPAAVVLGARPADAPKYVRRPSSP
jgi:hypothetical protein